VTAPAGSIVSSQFSSADLVLPKTVTIGSAGAEDTKLVFDGNAQDYHVGLDDSEDKLTIGLGSTLGTTSHMTFDSTGAILKPLQPAFLVRKASDSNNISTGTGVSVVFDTETFDQNGDFNNSTGVFTAPVTGRYQLNVHVYVQQIPVDTAYFYIQLNTSNNAILDIIDPAAYDQEMTYYTFSINILADMDASDTASVIVYQQGGTQQVDIDGSNEINTSFSGFLAC
jgi:hypothetical protein